MFPKQKKIVSSRHALARAEKRRSDLPADIFFCVPPDVDGAIDLACLHAVVCQFSARTGLDSNCESIWVQRYFGKVNALRPDRAHVQVPLMYPPRNRKRKPQAGAGRVERLRKLRTCYGLAQQGALHFVAPMLFQEGELGFSLNTFGDDSDA